MRSLLPVMGAVLICVLPLFLIAGPIQAYMVSTGHILLPLVLFAAVIVLLILPLIYGLMGFLMHLLGGGAPHLMSVFDGLSSTRKYVRCCKLGLCIFVRTVLWMAIPVGIVTVYCAAALMRLPEIMEQAEGLAQLLVQMSLLNLVVSLPFASRVLRYFAAYPLMMHDPALGAWKATRQAARAFKGQGLRLVVMLVSFLGWKIFGVWTMGVGTLFYWGYLLSTMLMYFWYLEHPDGEEPQVIPDP